MKHCTECGKEIGEDSTKTLCEECFKKVSEGFSVSTWGINKRGKVKKKGKYTKLRSAKT